MLFGLLFCLCLISHIQAKTEVSLQKSRIDWPIPLSSNVTWTSYEPFRVAFVAAGGLRSFAVVLESWRKYLFQHDYYFFAHVLLQHEECPMIAQGERLIKEVATEVEFSFADVPYIWLRDKDDRYVFERVICSDNPWLGEEWTRGLHRGNLPDMWSRRIRAYNMAMAYAAARNMSYDLIVLTRLDSAYYATSPVHPQLPLLHYHQALHQIREKRNQRGIIMPTACNWQGYCDRLAVGLPEEMSLYFAKNFINKTMEILKKPKDAAGSVAEKAAKVMGKCSSSEGLLRTWLYAVNNVYQVETRPMTARFITVKSENAEFYCTHSRMELERSPKYNIGLKFPLTVELGSEGYHQEDEVRDPIARCSKVYLTIPFKKMNETCLSA